MFRLAASLTSAWLFYSIAAASLSAQLTFDAVELQRFDAPEATQAVAVDERYFYAIANSVIAKYDKVSGERIGVWQANAEMPLTHLNAGVVIDGKLICSHSNYPKFPEASSIEIFDCETLTHLENHSLGIYEGSLTWVDWHDDAWWAVFAHYSKTNDPNPLAKPHTHTSLVKFDQQWRRTGGWIFPAEVLDRFAPDSCSGGGWANGKLYCTGHDRGELYELALPKAGSTLLLKRTITAPITGQGMAWDRSQPGVLFGISRPQRQVIAVQVPTGESIPREK